MWYSQLTILTDFPSCRGVVVGEGKGCGGVQALLLGVRELFAYLGCASNQCWSLELRSVTISHRRFVVVGDDKNLMFKPTVSGIKVFPIQSLG
jgi:hypothetical protein